MTLKLSKYKLSLKHDNGRVNIITNALSYQNAIQMVCEAEGCPERAIINIKRYAERTTRKT